MNLTTQTGRCIICRRDNVVLSGEHIIPKSLGGVSHCYQICKDCNSILGDHVDVGLVESPLSRLQRYARKLKGQSNTIPNPFDGTYTDDNGNKMRLELIDGKFVSHLIPEVNVDAAAGTFSVAIDVRDEKTRFNHQQRRKEEWFQVARSRPATDREDLESTQLY